MGLINKEQEYQDQETWSDNVEKLKGYKELKEEVEYWNKQKNVVRGSYEIIYDEELGWCVDVDGDVNFYGSNIKEIPFQFRNVSGDFAVCFTNINSLKGSPIFVGGRFDCVHCSYLRSLYGCPKTVGYNFECYSCGEYFPIEYVQSLCNVIWEIYNIWDQ